jgi:hypothetical protein
MSRKQIERLIEASVIEQPEPCRLIHDGAADSDPLRERLAKRGVKRICPQRANRVKPPTPGWPYGTTARACATFSR